MIIPNQGSKNSQNINPEQQFLFEDIENRFYIYNAIFLKALRYSVKSQLQELLRNFSDLDFALNDIINLPDNVIIHHGTPFFWLNLKRILRISTNYDDTESVLNIKRFIVSALDSFGDRLAISVVFQNALPGNESLVFPRLGIESARENIKERNDTEFTIDPWIPLQLDFINKDSMAHWKTRLLHKVKIPGTTNCYVLVDCSAAIIDERLLRDLGGSEDDGVRLAQELSVALSLISDVSPELGKSISDVVKWFIPINKFKSKTHYSFTSPQQGPVIFISRAADELRMAEAIVHEFSHIKLNVVSEIGGLTADRNESVYYSPWRDDPRPLSGLIHALFVFCEVDKFLSRTESRNRKKYSSIYVSKRRELIRQRLIIGSAQIDEKHITSIGNRIVSEIRLYIDYIGSSLAHSDLLHETLEHINRWEAKNPMMNIRLFGANHDKQ